MSKTLNLALFSLLIVFTACSTASVRVMPGENGQNEVIVRDIEQEDAEEEAVKAASKYCEEKKQEAVFASDKTNTKYTGKMDEGTRNAIKKGSTAAMIVGGATSAASQTAGAIIGTTGLVGYSTTRDRAYEARVSFKCR